MPNNISRHSMSLQCLLDEKLFKREYEFRQEKIEVELRRNILSLIFWRPQALLLIVIHLIKPVTGGFSTGEKPAHLKKYSSLLQTWDWNKGDWAWKKDSWTRPSRQQKRGAAGKTKKGKGTKIMAIV